MSGYDLGQKKSKYSKTNKTKKMFENEWKNIRETFVIKIQKWRQIYSSVNIRLKSKNVGHLDWDLGSAPLECNSCSFGGMMGHHPLVGYCLNGGHWDKENNKERDQKKGKKIRKKGKGWNRIIIMRERK